ncbi:sodium:proton antiporter [Scytonema hofmannii PCC 7110]|uniref:Sodium:proton antiporter n=2 Tax=Scytonema hofmannii TaxID=34078 RepID=A0A139X620_9CYAN|nr:sodium:proton antiporter [Scytonema hofmannii PCC 7110]
MSSLFSLTLCFVILLVSVTKGYFVAYSLGLSLVILLVTFTYQGFPFASLLKMGYISSQKAFSIITILLLIGVVTSIWMASGTIPALVYYGTQFINPQYFILSAFLLTCIISVLLGTSFGTVSTVGVALMIMAKEGNIDPHIIAGAIIAGAYFGDRCSPMSSSAHLIASLTKTNLYKNLAYLMTTAWFPFIASTIVYFFLSLGNPIQATSHNLLAEIPQIFDINFLVLCPALAVFFLCLMKIEVKVTLAISIAIALFLGIFVQNYSWLQMFQVIVFGFHLHSQTQLAEALTGGGIVSMLRVSLVVIISTFLVGIIVGTKTLASVEKLFRRISSKSGLFLSTIAVGLVSAAFGCTQTLAILMTYQLMKDKYEQEKMSHYQLAIDIENTAVVLAPLVPWNIAGLVPATVLMTDSGFIPYAVYLYLIPVFNWIGFKFVELRMQRKFE